MISSWATGDLRYKGPIKWKFSKEQVIEIKYLLRDKVNCKEIAEKFKVNIQSIYNIKMGVTYMSILLPLDKK